MAHSESFSWVTYSLSVSHEWSIWKHNLYKNLLRSQIRSWWYLLMLRTEVNLCMVEHLLFLKVYLMCLFSLNHLFFLLSARVCQGARRVSSLSDRNSRGGRDLRKSGRIVRKAWWKKKTNICLRMTSECGPAWKPESVHIWTIYFCDYLTLLLKPSDINMQMDKLQIIKVQNRRH